MILEVLLLIAGLVMLVYGSEKFVESCSRIAKKSGVSDFIIGLTLIAVGTSLPELASSITASLKGSSGLVVGNLFGSNIANIGLIVGISALINKIITQERMLKRDGYIMMFVTAIVAIFALRGWVDLIEGIVLIILYFAYVLFLMEYEKSVEKKIHFKHFLRYLIRFGFVKTLLNIKKEKNSVKKEGIGKDIALSIAGLAVLIYGAKLLVDGSLFLSNELGIADTFIGVAVIAVGTSLPELAVSISAARKGLNEILIGNIVGSNIANITLILGISAIISPVTIADYSLHYLVTGMVIFSALFLIFIKMGWKINRIQGAVLLAAYLIFIIFMGFRSG